MSALYRKELRSYFTGPMGYLFIIFLALFTGIFASMNNFDGYYTSDIGVTMNSMSFVFLLVTPILTMRVFAEERAKKTDQLLYSLPISVNGIVGAKYLAVLTVFAIPTLLLCVYPVVFSFFGDVNFVRSYIAIAGFFFMGCALLAIGVFISSLTENQVVSAIVTFAVMLLIFFSERIANALPQTASWSYFAFTACVILIGLLVFFLIKNFLVALASAALLEAALSVVFMVNKSLFTGLFTKFIQTMSVFSRYSDSIDGIINISDFVYYVSITLLFVFFTVQSVEKRRWS